ncbi:acylphosphatase [bacterium]|nr:acylphosphatase [bacterium]
MERRVYRISGGVQGVGYRAFARRAARALGLQGWVANRPDGSVALLVAGPAAALDALESELRRGPAAATVRAVERLPAAEAADFSGEGFEIRYG